MDVMDLGRMAVFADPTGAVFGVWQPKTFAGADLVNEPNSLCWNEVLTRDSETDKAFYTRGVRVGRGQAGFRGRPRELHGLGAGRKAGRRHEQMTDEMFPAEVPPHWSVCFLVADATHRPNGPGTSARRSPASRWTCRWGGTPALIDPQGASFAVMQMPTG